MECFSLFRYYQKQIRNKILGVPTGSERHLLELLVPRVGDFYGLLLAHNTLSTISLLAGVLQNLLQVLGVERVEDIEKVVVVGHPVAGVNVLEVEHKGLVLLQVAPQVFDGELLEVGDVDVVDVLLLVEPLLVVENLFQEILVALPFRRNIILNYREVREENDVTYVACQGNCKNRPWRTACP